MTSIHQTTNFVFPNFFHEFFSVLAVEKENKIFIGPKYVFSKFENWKRNGNRYVLDSSFMFFVEIGI